MCYNTMIPIQTSYNKSKYTNMDIENLCRKIENLEISSTKNKACTHPIFIKNLCISCLQKAEFGYNSIVSTYNSSIPLRYIRDDLKLSKGEIALLKNTNTEKMLNRKKLYLVLDLDHTLVHSISPKDMKSDEKYLMKYILSGGDLSYVLGMVVKLRPFVKEFLKEASDMFDMYMYTMGDHDYANSIAKLLDPKGVYFGRRIVSRKDCYRPHLKSLDIVLGKESSVVILDDRKDVWPDHKKNILSIDNYSFFVGNGRRGCKSIAQMKKRGENEDDVALVSVLDELKKIHMKFFEGCDEAKILERDVREVIKEVRLSSF